MAYINGKKDSANSKMANKAADISALAQAVWTEKSFEVKRTRAVEMAEAFEVGGKEDFIKAVLASANAMALDKLVGNAMLKGEGMSTKRW